MGLKFRGNEERKDEQDQDDSMLVCMIVFDVYGIVG